MIPTEGVVDLTAMLTAMMNQTGAGLSGYEIQHCTKK